MIREAVILAAGRGSRLGEHTDEIPKCLAEVGGRTLIDHQIESLRQVGIEQVTVVTGYGDEMVRDRLNGLCTYVHNERYSETNSLYSLWLARTAVSDGFVLLNCDVLADPAIYRAAAQQPGSVLTFDSQSGADEEEMKVRVEAGCLRDIRKDLPTEETSGENVGILGFDRDRAARLFAACEEIIGEWGENAWAPAAVGRLSATEDIRCVDVAGLPWIEIDFPADLDRARTVAWPAIKLRQRSCCATGGASGTLRAKWNGHISAGRAD